MQNIFKFEPKHLNHSSLKKIHIILENLQITLNTFQDKLKNSLKKIFDSIPSSISKLQTPRPNISPNQRGTSSKNFVSKEPVAEENARISSHSCMVAYLDNGKGACKGSSSLEREHAPPSPPLSLSLSCFSLPSFHVLLSLLACMRAVASSDSASARILPAEFKGGLAIVFGKDQCDRFAGLPHGKPG